MGRSVKYMQITECLSLCDRMEEKNIKKQENNGRNIKRVYLGSYFCSNYFMNLDLNLLERIVTECIYNDIDITLVIPIITEKNFKAMKEKIEKLFKFAGDSIDEITVNDYGTLECMHQQYPIALNLGRLFAKDYRDPRYQDSFDMTCKPNIFTTEFQTIVKRFHIKGIEFDPISKCLDFSEAIPELSYAIHSPYCYVTTGQICEFGSISNQNEKKFRPNSDCHRECVNITKTYGLQEEQEWYRLGKAVYFKNNDCEIKGIDKIRRIIWCADFGDSMEQHD